MTGARASAPATRAPSAPEARSVAPPPRPKFRDHLAVLGLLLRTLLGAVPFALHVIVGPFATPKARRALARLLAEPPPPPHEAPAPDAARWAGRTVFVVAGEPSGDRLAANVVRAMRRAAPDLAVRGYGGPALAAAGATLDRQIVDHAVVGASAVLATIPYWWRLCAETLARWRQSPPDLVLTVDFPGLNLRLDRWARKRGIPVVHLVAPQTWAWAPWRTRRLRAAVDLLLVTFPFEAAWFAERGISTRYVGHPLFEAPLPPPRSPESKPADPLVELRPGSRRRDVRRQAPLVLDAARECGHVVPNARFLVRLASERVRPAFEEAVAKAGGLPPGVDVWPKAARRADDMPAHSVEPVSPVAGAPFPDVPVTAALTTSGTSTAELAVDQVPMVVFYRLPWFLRLVRPLALASPWFAMANVLAGRPVVVERLVGRRDGPALGRELVALLRDDERWKSTRAALGTVRDAVAHPDVADRTARAVLDVDPRASPTRDESRLRA